MKYFAGKSGFTVLELLIFSAIFAIASVAFIGILVTVSRIQVRQSAATEVNQQSLFLLQTLQRYIEQSSLVELAADTATSTLKLRMPSSQIDPTYIYLSGTKVYLKETDGGAAQPLTSDKVNGTNLTFTKRSNPSGRDSVSLTFTMDYNAANPQQKFSQLLSTSVARVSAATFDSDVVPNTGGVRKLGLSAEDWKSINNTIFFSGSNVGIGASSPNQTLEVNGGVRLLTTSGQPTCDVNQRGTLWYTQSGGGTKDYFRVCVKNASDTYAWFTIY
jgi:type II secretory pathway pseudopilin PulG